MPETEAPEKPTAPTESAFEPITSQEEYDARTKDRLAREEKRITAKYKDYEALKTKAAELDSLKAASMTHEEKAAAQISELQTALSDQAAQFAEQIRAITRKSVAEAKDVPVETITGDTREEMEASADALLEWRGKGKPRGFVGVPAGGSGASTTISAPAGSMDAQRQKMELAASMLRQYYGTGGPGKR
jgi:hypothetical protein